MYTQTKQPPVVEHLREQLRRFQCAHRPNSDAVSSGCEALDRLLPDGGIRRGTLMEYLADAGSGAVGLALIAAREACRDGGALVSIDRSRSFYPPPAANLSLDPNTVCVRPRTRKDELWALHQALRCQGVGAVLCWPEKLDDRAFRSLQLAAETGGAVGLFVRPLSAGLQPTWSDLQLLIETLPTANRVRRLRINIVRCRFGNVGASVELELDDETGTLQESRSMSVAPAVALTAAACGAARA